MGEEVAGQIRYFFRLMVDGHFVRFKQAFHLRTPVGKHKTAGGGDVKNTLVHGPFHLLAGAVKVEV